MIRPQRTLILNNHLAETLMDKLDWMSAVTNEDLKQLIDNGVIKWKPILLNIWNADGL